MGFIIFWIVNSIYIYSTGEPKSCGNSPYSCVQWNNNIRGLLVYNFFVLFWYWLNNLGFVNSLFPFHNILSLQLQHYGTTHMFMINIMYVLCVEVLVEPSSIILVLLLLEDLYWLSLLYCKFLWEYSIGL